MVLISNHLFPFSYVKGKKLVGSFHQDPNIVLIGINQPVPFPFESCLHGQVSPSRGYDLGTDSATGCSATAQDSYDAAGKLIRVATNETYINDLPGEKEL